MEQRYEVATLLNDGMLYSDILEKTGASSATISRVNRSLLNGAGGYENVLGSVHTVLDEKCFWEIIGKLKALGAEGILVLPIEKMII